MKPETRAKIQEALDLFEIWWRLPRQLRTVERIEPAMRLCLESKEALAAEPDEPTASGNALEIAHNVAGKRGVDIANEIQMFAERYAASKQPTASKSVEELARGIHGMAMVISDGWVCDDSLLDDPEELTRLSETVISNTAYLIQQFLDAQIAERDNRIEEFESEVRYYSERDAGASL